MSLNHQVALWHRFEIEFRSTLTYANALQDAALQVEFTAPSGKKQVVDAFWDGGLTWRVRFLPAEIGPWTFTSSCSDQNNPGLDRQTGEFEATGPSGETIFEKHGPVQISASHRYLEHADGTPFLWIGDTAWSGPMLSTQAEWQTYLAARHAQQFSAVQWVPTQWICTPNGDLEGDRAFEGHDRIRIHPRLFQKLDQKVDAMNAAGLLSAPVLAWAAEWGSENVMSVNPGLTLPEGQIILLEKYMVARWGANAVLWILNGDGYYVGKTAERWKRIGQAVFGRRPHAPVTLHPCGANLFFDEFRNEEWLDIIGYQSGHGGWERDWNWLVYGPPAIDWQKPPFRPFINLEPCYENHHNYSKGGDERFDSSDVRCALYTSLLVSPMAGATYGGHGVWGWDDGTQPPAAHPTTGVPLPWQKALHMAAAEQIRHLVDLFTSLEWWKLVPYPEALGNVPWNRDSRHARSAAQTAGGGVILVYSPAGNEISLDAHAVGPRNESTWFDPRTGEKFLAGYTSENDVQKYLAPSDADWVLVLEK